MLDVIKMAIRTIRTHFTRFLAVMLIVMLSAGFFAGLKITTSAMIKTGEKYITDYNLYDFRIFSSIGFDKEVLTDFENINGVRTVEGTYSLDALVERDGKVTPYKILALT